MASITSANSVVTLSAAGLFPVPQQLQGYSADRAWENANVTMTESIIGVDGKKSTGYVFQLVEQTYVLMPDSPSRPGFFTPLINTMRQTRETIVLSGTIDLPSTGESFICNNGSLKTAPPMPGAGRMLEPTSYVIEWESIVPTIS